MQRVTLFVVAALTLAAPASAAIPAIYKNCTALNKKYPHGLGRANARDKTSGVPVTTFTRNTRLYNIADRHNGASTATTTGSPARRSSRARLLARVLSYAKTTAPATARG
jgi:hypothetical protein